jgi:hypothetical protein
MEDRFQKHNIEEKGQVGEQKHCDPIYVQFQTEPCGGLFMDLYASDEGTKLVLFLHQISDNGCI